MPWGLTEGGFVTDGACQSFLHWLHLTRLGSYKEQWFCLTFQQTLESRGRAAGTTLIARHPGNPLFNETTVLPNSVQWSWNAANKTEPCEWRSYHYPMFASLHLEQFSIIQLLTIPNFISIPLSARCAIFLTLHIHSQSGQGSRKHVIGPHPCVIKIWPFSSHFVSLLLYSTPSQITLNQMQTAQR